jgi:prepilin-type N-terminal cleavage/methylation domain-containing protein
MFRFPKRHALTLIELMIASSIMAIMAGVLGGLALSVQMQSRHSQSHGEAVQHARVVLERIQRTMNEARTSVSFPGFFVVPDTFSSYSLPDTVVVWHPTGAVANPTGLPRWCEVVVFTPDSAAPNRLLEITNTADTRTVPALTALSTWRTEIASLKASASSTKTELTNLVRAPNLQASGSPRLAAAIRFDQQSRPDDTQWAEYKAGTRTWENLDWVQSIYGTKTGLRQSWCRIELQLQPVTEQDLDQINAQTTLTFFGSAAVYQKMYHD